MSRHNSNKMISKQSRFLTSMIHKHKLGWRSIENKNWPTVQNKLIYTCIINSRHNIITILPVALIFLMHTYMRLSLLSTGHIDAHISIYYIPCQAPSMQNLIILPLNNFFEQMPLNNSNKKSVSQAKIKETCICFCHFPSRTNHETRACH